MKPTYILISIALFTAQLSVFGQQFNTYFESYSKEDYEGGRQNWDVEIDDNGVVYFANTDGLLYNVFGEWGLAEVNEGGFISAIKSNNDTIWAGGNHIGYFIKQNGQYQYQFIAEALDQIWNIEVLDGKIIFQGSNRLLIYSIADELLQTEVFDHRIWSITNWNDSIWMGFIDGRVGYWDSNEFKEVAVLDEIKGKELRRMFDHNGLLYFVMIEGGVFSFDGSELTKVDLPKELSGQSLFTGIHYDQHSFCLGSIGQGFFRISDDGSVLESINAQDGLNDDTVLDVAIDANGVAWVALDFGIAKVEIQSPFSPNYFGAATYKVVDTGSEVLLATNKGLFQSMSTGGFEKIKDSDGQVWNIKEIDGVRYVCHNRGLFELNEDLKLIQTYDRGTLDIVRFEDTDLYLLATYEDLMFTRKVNGNFQIIHNLQTYGVSSLIYDQERKIIWSQTNEGRSNKITLSGNGTVIVDDVQKVQRIFQTPLGVFYHGGNGILAYENDELRSSDHPLLSRIEGDIRKLTINAEGTKVAYLKDGKVFLETLLDDGTIKSHTKQLEFMEQSLIENHEYFDFSDDAILFTTDRGIIRLDLDHSENFNASKSATISSVNVVSKDMKYHFPFDKEGIDLQKDERDLQFMFSANASYYDHIEYRYRINTRDSDWSDWTDVNTLFITQLGGGDYVLKVEAMVNGLPTESSQVSFRIEKFWYETGLILVPVLAIVTVLILAIVLLMSTINKRKLKQQSIRLAEENAQKTLNLKNEQLLQYVEIIGHKNEFLSKVKVGFEKMRNNESKRWANLIDKEVNHEKKEFLFHKLFGEVHQDFIARISHDFPTLTSNDLRILTFIRVNLDNKEISNLMNISPKSLETSRYRIRNKLALDRKANLNQFVRDF